MDKLDRKERTPTMDDLMGVHLIQGKNPIHWILKTDCINVQLMKNKDCILINAIMANFNA